MNGKCLLATCCLSLAGLQSASADSSGLYLLLEVGNSDVDRYVSSVDRINGDDTSLAIGLGYELTPNWSIQVAYVDFGNVAATVGCPPELLCIAQASTTLVPFSADTAEIDGVAIEVLGSYPIPNFPLAVFGKVGVLDWDSNWTLNSSFDESKTALSYGVGLKWLQDSSRWGLALSYDNVDMDITSVKLSATFHF